MASLFLGFKIADQAISISSLCYVELARSTEYGELSRYEFMLHQAKLASLHRRRLYAVVDGGR
jgi:hypothetical protein